MSSVESVGKRFGLYLSHQGIGVNEAGKRLNSSGPQVSRMVKGGNFNLEMLLRIFETFPEINRDWLILGQGSMLQSKERNQTLQRLDTIYEEIEQLKKAFTPGKDERTNALAHELFEVINLLLTENNKQKNKLIGQYELLNRYRQLLEQDDD